jgi:hypothetical protein
MTELAQVTGMMRIITITADKQPRLVCNKHYPHWQVVTDFHRRGASVEPEYGHLSELSELQDAILPLLSAFCE